MNKIFIILVTAVGTASCIRGGDEFNHCPLTVTCRDMTGDQSSNTLNIWAGYCSEPEQIDLDYLENLDGGKGNILPLIAGYNFVYIDPEQARVAGPVHITAWYRPQIDALRITYKNLASGNDIHPEIIIRDLPPGQIIDDEYLTDNDYIPDIESFVMEYYELTTVPGAAEGVLTVWYDPLFTVRVRYCISDPYEYIDLKEPGFARNVKRGTFVTQSYLTDLGLFEYGFILDGRWWTHRWTMPENFIVTSNCDMVLYYLYDQ